MNAPRRDRYSRTIIVDGQRATVELQALRGDAGELRFELTWWGGPPTRFEPGFCGRVDEAKRIAIAAIRAELGEPL